MDEGQPASEEPPRDDDVIDADDAPLAASALRAVADDVRSAFPRPFSEAEVVLIDVDPQHLHAFWNLPLDRLEAARAALPEGDGETAPVVLRIARADGGEPFDIEVQGLKGQAYVDIWDEARTWRASLGLRRADGSLAVLIDGGRATLPRLGPAPQATALLEVTPPSCGRLAPATMARPSSPVATPVDRAAAPAASAGAPPADVLVEPFPPPPSEAGEFDPTGMPPAIGNSGGEAPPPAPPPADSPSANTPPADSPPANTPPAGDPPTIPAAGPPPDAGGESPAAPLELESVLSLSSFILGRDTVQLEVSAELRVFGRARPGSDLRLFGRRVPLRPDGSFSVTRPLPNGAVVLTGLLTGGDDDS